MLSQTYSRVARNTLSLVAGRLLSRLLQFLMVVYAARTLGADQFGIFSFAYALTALLSIFMDLGISSYIVQKLSKDTKPTGLYMGAGLLVKSALILAALVLAIIIAVIMDRKLESISVLLLLGIFAALNSISSLFAAIFQSREQMQYEAFLASAGGLLVAVAGIGSLYLFSDLFIFSAAFAVGGLLRLILHVRWCTKLYGPPHWSFEPSLGIHLLRRGLPFALVSGFVATYYYIDTLIIAGYWNNEVVGWYNAAYRLLEAPLFVSSAFTTAMFPAASRLFDKNRYDLSVFVTHAFEKALLAGTCMVLPVIFFAQPLIKIIYGDGYESSAEVVPVLMMSVAVIFPSTMLGTTIRAIGKQSSSAWVTGVGATLNISLNLLVVPYYSYHGAAWTTLATEIFVLIAYIRLARASLGSFIRPVAIFRSLGILATLCVFLYFTLSLGIWLQLVGYGALFISLVITARVVSIHQLRTLAEALIPNARRSSS